MATEIERKYLLAGLPGDVELGPGSGLRQGYLAEEGQVEVRIRVAGSSATLTVKAGKGLRRTEVETAVGLDEAEALYSFTEGRRIEKVRHRFDLVGGLVAEVDLYGGSLEGLRTVEVELPSEEAAEAFEPPMWFGRELTDEPGWGNAALARHGRPDQG
jgi:adenylate cyclase